MTCCSLYRAGSEAPSLIATSSLVRETKKYDIVNYSPYTRYGGDYCKPRQQPKRKRIVTRRYIVGLGIPPKVVPEHERTVRPYDNDRRKKTSPGKRFFAFFFLLLKSALYLFPHSCVQYHPRALPLGGLGELPTENNIISSRVHFHLIACPLQGLVRYQC